MSMYSVGMASARLTLLAVAVCLSPYPFAEAQAPVVVAGTVVDERGQGVAGALVSLGETKTSNSEAVLTEATGRFVIVSRRAGTLPLIAWKRGYAEGALGRLWPAGPAQLLSLRSDTPVVFGLSLRIWRHSVVTGRAVDSLGEPLIGATVKLVPRHSPGSKLSNVPLTGATDDQGSYRIASVPAGQYVAAIAMPQLSAPEGVVTAFARTQVSDPDRTSDAMKRYSASRVGPPLDRFTSGSLRLADQSVLSPSAGSVMHVSTGGPLMSAPLTYYPGVRTEREAMVLSLSPGEERNGIDFNLIPQQAFSVSGVVTGPEGPVSVGLSLVPAADSQALPSDFQVAATWSDSAGRFVFVGVPGGAYVIRVIWAPEVSRSETVSGPALLWASQRVSVVADEHDLVVPLRRGFRLSGHLRFEGPSAPKPDEIRRLLGTIERADGTPWEAPSLGWIAFASDGRFVTRELPADEYRVSLDAAPVGWTVKSITLDERDVIDSAILLDRDRAGLAMTFTNQPTEVNGLVRGNAGPEPGATVLVFPARPDAWLTSAANSPRFLAVRVQPDGTYRIRGLPPGQYVFAATSHTDLSSWRTEGFLKRLAMFSQPTDLAAGDKRFLQLETLIVR